MRSWSHVRPFQIQGPRVRSIVRGAYSSPGGSQFPSGSWSSSWKIPWELDQRAPRKLTGDWLCVYGCVNGYRQAKCLCVYTVPGKWGSPEILPGVHPPVTGVHDGSCQTDVPGLHRHSLRLLCSMLRQHFQWGVSGLQIRILYAQSCFPHPNYRKSTLMELPCLEICTHWALCPAHTSVILLNKVSLHLSKVGAG